MHMPASVKELLRHLIYFVYWALPKCNWAVVYGWPDFEDNALALEASLNQTTVRKVVLFVTAHSENSRFVFGKKTIVVRKNTLRGGCYFLLARYVFFTHRCFMFRFPPHVVSVNLWHGMPIKKIGCLLPGGRPYASKYALATSDFWAAVVDKSLQPWGETLVTGLPRNDRIGPVADPFWERAGLAAAITGKKIIGWLPTYRQSVTGEIRSDGKEPGNVFGVAGILPGELNEFLRQRQGFAIVKPHPMASPAAHRQWSNLLIIDEAWLRRQATSLYALLGQCHLLVTDMSSVVVDYLVLDRPVIQLIPDLAAYRGSRGFSIEPVEDYFAGPLVTEAWELYAQLAAVLRGEDSHQPQRQRIRQLFHQQPDRQATQRLLAALHLYSPSASPPAGVAPACPGPATSPSGLATLSPTRPNAGMPQMPGPLLRSYEGRRSMTEPNQTLKPYPHDQCIHQLFAAQAAQTPDAVAVVFQDNLLTYQELNEQATLVAQHLHNMGVCSNTIVGLFVERSLEMAIALLGILKAGAAYCALDATLPAERLRWLLADAGVEITIARRNSIPRLTQLAPPTAPRRLVIAGIEDLLATRASGTGLSTAAHQSGDPAYVSYTSGSTGQPKGVVVPHRGVVRLVKGADYVSLTAAETLLHLSPLSFDASTFEIWGALLNGGRVVIMPPAPCSLTEIGATIRRDGVTTLFLTSGLFHLLVEERLEDLQPLRQLLTGGDVLSPLHVLKAFRALPHCRIMNVYGPTENTTFTTCYTVTDPAELTPSVPVGRPIANTQVYVLDQWLNPVPPGEKGELYVGGDGLAIGYLNRPELTAEMFVPSPFNPTTRLYRTGDIMRWRSDGNLEFLGRRDSQVKIRGFRIELGEVESILATHPKVAACAVTTQPLADGNKTLVAHVVGRAAADLTPDSLRSWLLKKLPDYMVPSRFFQMPVLPLNANGKVDRKSLSEYPGTEWSPSRDDTAPRNDLERRLVDVWQSLLNKPTIGIRDNFFHLGGDSLLALQLTCALEKIAGVALPMATLLQSPTIESLAQRLSAKDWVPAWSSLVPLQTQGSKPPLFFVHGVRGEVYRYLDLVRRLSPDQPCYGFQAVGLDGRVPRHITVEEMAAHYVQELVTFQPSGAVFLAGYSMGGWIAYEMAQQLQRQGRQVRLLALLDSGPAGRVRPSHYVMQMACFLPRRFAFHLWRWLQLPQSEQFAYLRRRWVSLWQVLSQNRAPAPVVTVPPDKSAQPPPVAPEFIDYYHAVAATYQLRQYSGTVDVFVSDQYYPGWKSYWHHMARGGASVHRIPGEHFQIFSETKLPVFAATFTHVLQRAQQQAGNPPASE